MRKTGNGQAGKHPSPVTRSARPLHSPGGGPRQDKGSWETPAPHLSPVLVTRVSVQHPQPRSRAEPEAGGRGSPGSRDRGGRGSPRSQHRGALVTEHSCSRQQRGESRPTGRGEEQRERSGGGGPGPGQPACRGQMGSRPVSSGGRGCPSPTQRPFCPGHWDHNGPVFSFAPSPWAEGGGGSEGRQPPPGDQAQQGAAGGTEGLELNDGRAGSSGARQAERGGWRAPGRAVCLHTGWTTGTPPSVSLPPSLPPCPSFSPCPSLPSSLSLPPTSSPGTKPLAEQNLGRNVKGTENQDSRG